MILQTSAYKLKQFEQKEEAVQFLLTVLDEQHIYNTVSASTFIVEKLVEYGITPNAIMAAFTEDKKDVGSTNS